jgi:hypothetical protein
VRELIAFVAARLDEDQSAAAWESKSVSAGCHDRARTEREARAYRTVLGVAASAWEELESVTADPGAGGEARAMALGKMTTAMTILLSLASVWEDHPGYAAAAHCGAEGG